MLDCASLGCLARVAVLEGIVVVAVVAFTLDCVYACAGVVGCVCVLDIGPIGN